MVSRRSFLTVMAGAATGMAMAPSRGRVSLAPVRPDEDVFQYLERVHGSFRAGAFKAILGAANPFKEGDAIVGVAAADETARGRARQLLAATRVADLDAHPVLADQLHDWLRASTRTTDDPAAAGWTLGELKQFLLQRGEAEIRAVMPVLSSQVIGCVVKLLSNDELIAVGRKVFNPLPGSRIGARGYLGARIQPNSPTDHVDDIRWQVWNGWSYAVGDVLLGTNPVSSTPESVSGIQRTLKDLLATFQIDDAMPHCVLSHIDVQAEVEAKDPGSTALWFQSIAGSDAANRTFDISTRKMVDYAARRTGRFGLYFETGQGADFTNGHGHGFDMVLHEARKYGMARALSQHVAHVDARDGSRPWVHLNDVAGFIGPEVFRTRSQLVRCCLEDIVMGKLHGLCIGLDVCSTLHMDVSLDDLDWCLDQIMPANPAYLMALPTKIDPMLGYLTTGFQDHVRLREKFGYRVDDRIWRFFGELGVIDAGGRPTEHFGDPLWVFQQYCRRKGDRRGDAEIRAEGERRLAEVAERGVFIARGHGRRPWDLEPDLRRQIDRIYTDAKKSIWAELEPPFVAQIPRAVRLQTRSADREDYILHPATGERLNEASRGVLAELRDRHAGKYGAQIVVSDGLNALAIMDAGHLDPFLQQLRRRLDEHGWRVAPEPLIVRHGRVRAGYRIGEQLFAHLPGPRGILHVIGERPGTGHRTFSLYMTAPQGSVWARPGVVDHNITRVVSGMASTALAPVRGADEAARILQQMV